MDIEVEEFLQDLPRNALIIPVGTEAILLGNSTVAGEDLEAVNRYLVFGEGKISATRGFISQGACSGTDPRAGRRKRTSRFRLLKKCPSQGSSV
jgi:hypothetical protein